MCLRVSFKKKKIFLVSLKSLKKGAGFGSISQRYGSADPALDPDQNVTDPQHWLRLWHWLPDALTTRLDLIRDD